jgi:hypothetical protein
MSEIYRGMGGDPNTYTHPVIALVIDGEIVSVLNTDERLGAILLSNPTIVDISQAQKETPSLCEGWTYDGSNFFPPQRETEDNENEQ